mmetsp:Transcript_21270/g.9792  ORF Transcript_21270/g.9792 Transcript_21270/m.9792 type:complete len:166 (+) Transcript_21270:20-517(+)
MRCAEDWERVTTRLGRWIDFRNDYKTLDTDFMESCWWVFKCLWDKQLVYRSAKIMPYSTGCATVISNFEANLNYKDISDPSIFVLFPLVDSPDTALVAWTTTPWTLASNLVCAVHPDFIYCKLQDNASGKFYIMLEKLVAEVYKTTGMTQGYNIIERFPGSALAN